VNGPASVFFRNLSYPKIRANKKDDVTSAGILTINDKPRAKTDNAVTRPIAALLDTLPEAMGLSAFLSYQYYNQRDHLVLVPHNKAEWK
jgi:hypothetical protein